MKSFKLLKRLGSFITAVAVLASMGTVAFADTTGVTVSIEDATFEAITENSQDLYEVTVDYKVTGTVGSRGITMLAYAKANETADDLVAGENFTQYNSTDYKVAYITQKTPDLDANGEGSLVFKVNTTGDYAVDLGSGEKMLILLGGDGVLAPDARLVYIPEETISWTATSATYAGTDIPNVITAEDGYDVEAYAKGKLAGQKVTLSDGTNNAEITLTSEGEGNFSVTTVKGAFDENNTATVTATVTIPAGTMTVEGEEITIDEALTFDLTFTLEIGAIKYGDVSGDTVVDMADAILIWQYELGKTSLTDDQQVAADVNGDTIVDMSDAILIWQYELGKISSFPVEQ